MKRVFISYSRETPQQERRVRQFAERLRGDGLEVRLDQDEDRIDEPLTRWMEREMAAADAVLVIITEAYGRRQGTAFESQLMIQELFEASMRNEKYVPVVFADADARFIPRPLRSYRFFQVDTEAGYGALLRHLGGQAATAAAAGQSRRGVWKISLAAALLVTAGFLVFRLLPSGAENPQGGHPAAPSTAAPEESVPPAATPAPLVEETPEETPRKDHPRQEPSPTPPPPPPTQETPLSTRVEVSGTGFASAQLPTERRKALARRAAEVDARRRLAEAIETRIQAQTRVVDGVVEKDEIVATVDQLVKGARVVRERELPDGGYEVTIEAQLSLGKEEE